MDYNKILDNAILAKCEFLSDVRVIPRCIKCGSYEMVIDATQEMADGVIALNPYSLNQDMPVIRRKTKLPRFARIKYYCKRCGAQMEACATTIPEIHIKWNEAWYSEQATREREELDRQLRAREAVQEQMDEISHELFMQKALETKTTLKLTREQAIRAGLIYPVFGPKKISLVWRFRKRWNPWRKD